MELSAFDGALGEPERNEIQGGGVDNCLRDDESVLRSIGGSRSDTFNRKISTRSRSPARGKSATRQSRSFRPAGGAFWALARARAAGRRTSMHMACNPARTESLDFLRKIGLLEK
jgi:hypothetical protein